MIPKVIHYCWFGRNPLPQAALKCINSWKKYFPDYEIKEWNENNFDVEKYAYTREAYAAKKYAFVSDFARFWILYHYGGLYFDTDVEVVKDFDKIISKGPFMGFELNPINDYGKDMRVNPGLGIGVTPMHPIYKELLDLYQSMHWVSYSESTGVMPTVVDYTTNILKEKGLTVVEGIQCINGIYIYPTKFFCPISINSGKLEMTDETYSIHWFNQSWQSPIRKYGRKILIKVGGTHLKNFVKKILKLK